jgi:hypothetical protein
MAQVVELLLTKCEILSSNPNIAQKTKKKRICRKVVLEQEALNKWTKFWGKGRNLELITYSMATLG